MSLQVAIEHSDAKHLLEDAEKRDGKIGVYRIELADNLEARGFAPLPEGPITAHLVYQKDSPRYMFTNMMDNYCRCSLVDAADLKAEPVLIRTETPNADLAEARLAKERLRQEAAERVKEREQKQEQEFQNKLGQVNDFAMLIGMGPVPKDGLHRIRTSRIHAKMEDLAISQGGKLSLAEIPKPELNGSRFNEGILNGVLNHGKYIALGNHDISLTIEKSGVRPGTAFIQIKDLEGRALASATVGFNSEKRRYIQSYADYLEEHEDHGVDDVFTVYSMDLKGESGVKPVFMENGRPTLLKNSHFKTLYRELQQAEMALYPDVYMGNHVHKATFGNATPIAIATLMAKPQLVKEVGQSRAMDRGRSKSIEQGMSA